MNDQLCHKMETWFYYLIKEAARSSYADFKKELCELSEDEYDEMKGFIEEKLGIRLSL